MDVNSTGMINQGWDSARLYIVVGRRQKSNIGFGYQQLWNDTMNKVVGKLSRTNNVHACGSSRMIRYMCVRRTRRKKNMFPFKKNARLQIIISYSSFLNP